MKRIFPIMLLTLIIVAASFVPVTAAKQFLFNGHLSGTGNGAAAQGRYMNASSSIEIDIQVTRGTFNFQIVSQSDFLAHPVAGPFDHPYVKATQITGNNTVYWQVPSDGVYYFVLDDYGSTAPSSNADYQVWLLETPISPIVIIAAIGLLGGILFVFACIALIARKRSHYAQKA